jgi:DNA-binding NarL/FixJ family response regulator
MSNTSAANRQQNRVIRLMLVEDDPVFRLGLITALEEFPDLRVIFEADSSVSTIRILQDWMGTRSPELTSSQVDNSIAPDLVILSLDLHQTRTGQGVGLTLCQQLRARYPELPLLLLSARQDPLELAMALQVGAAGYCPKGTKIGQLVGAIRVVAKGQSYWNPAIRTITQALATSQSSASGFAGQSATAIALPTSVGEESTGSPISGAPGPLAVLRRNLRRSGLQQIDQAIALLNAQLQNSDLSVIDQLYLTGRRRELRAARWFVNRLLVSAREKFGESRSLNSFQSSVFNPQSSTLSPQPSTPNPQPPPRSPSSLLPLPAPPTSLRYVRAALFDSTATKLQTGLRNLTSTPLEIDILKEEKKRELLYTILRKLEEILDDLRFSQVQPDQLMDKQTAVLLDLWQATMTDFFGRYYTLQLGVGDRTNLAGAFASQDSANPVEMVEVLLQDAAIVKTDILDRIPLVAEFLAHLLFQTPLTIDDDAYAVGSVEAMARMEILLHNLIIQIANAVMQPLLNRFGNVEVIKRSYYDKRLLSTREIERFRNDLSWRYRLDRYFGEPTAIFESRFNLLALQDGGITRASIYAPRNQELGQLSGIPLAVTLVLEARDAISPRLRSTIAFLGSGVVYVLTDVIGRGIGLIGRGIVKGIGTAFQENRFNRNSER